MNFVLQTTLIRLNRVRSDQVNLDRKKGHRKLRTDKRRNGVKLLES